MSRGERVLQVIDKNEVPFPLPISCGNYPAAAVLRLRLKLFALVIRPAPPSPQPNTQRDLGYGDFRNDQTDHQS